MPNPEYLSQLIDQASKAAGSDYKLAEELGVTRFNVSNWRHGRTTCPAADQALMASIAGLEPEAWLARATVAQYEGAKAVKLERALKKSLAQIGGVTATFGFIVAGVSYLIRCIEGQQPAALASTGFTPIRRWQPNNAA